MANQSLTSAVMLVLKQIDKKRVRFLIHQALANILFKGGGGVNQTPKRKLTSSIELLNHLLGAFIIDFMKFLMFIILLIQVVLNAASYDIQRSKLIDKYANIIHCPK